MFFLNIIIIIVVVVIVIIIVVAIIVIIIVIVLHERSSAVVLVFARQLLSIIHTRIIFLTGEKHCFGDKAHAWALADVTPHLNRRGCQQEGSLHCKRCQQFSFSLHCKGCQQQGSNWRRGLKGWVPTSTFQTSLVGPRRLIKLLDRRPTSFLPIRALCSARQFALAEDTTILK